MMKNGMQIIQLGVMRRPGSYESRRMFVVGSSFIVETVHQLTSSVGHVVK